MLGLIIVGLVPATAAAVWACMCLWTKRYLNKPTTHWQSLVMLSGAIGGAILIFEIGINIELALKKAIDTEKALSSIATTSDRDSTESSQDEAPDEVFIQIGKNGELAVNEEPSSLSTLLQDISAVHIANSRTIITLNADEQTAYEHVEKILAILKTGDFGTITFTVGGDEF